MTSILNFKYGAFRYSTLKRLFALNTSVGFSAAARWRRRRRAFEHAAAALYFAEHAGWRAVAERKAFCSVRWL